MQEEREACLAAGMDAYLSKPIDRDELAAALSRFRPRAPVQAHEPAAGPQLPAEGPEPQGQASSTDALDTRALERLVKITGDAAGLLAGLIDTFLEDVPRLLGDAKRGLRQEQAEEVRRAAHTLKSTGATFGATRLSDMSRSLEALASTGSLAGAANLIPRMEAEYQEVREALAAVRKRGGR
jgi:HPt (histidine-containing phosphotransfer) domain-containing protein